MKLALLFTLIAGTAFQVSSQPDGFTLVKEITEVHPENSAFDLAKFTPHDHGVLIQYMKKQKMQMWGYEANVGKNGAFIAIDSLNGSKAGTGYSKTHVTLVEDVNDGLLLMQDPNLYDDIYFEIYNVETAKQEHKIYLKYTGFDKVGRIAKKQEFYNANGWQVLQTPHKYIYSDHVVVPAWVKLNSTKKFAQMPSIIWLNKPDEMVPILPDLPPLPAEEDPDHTSAWGYYGSNGKHHYFSRGVYRNNKKTKTVEVSRYTVAMVDNYGKVEKMIEVDMKMPGLNIVDEEKYEGARNNGLFVQHASNTLLFIATGEDKKGETYLVVKQYTNEGELMWETMNKLSDDFMQKSANYNSVNLDRWNKQLIYSSSGRMSGKVYTLDETNGKLLEEAKMNLSGGSSSSAPVVALVDKYGPAASTKINALMKADKDLKRLLYLDVLNDDVYLVSFWTKQNGIKIYTLKK